MRDQEIFWLTWIRLLAEILGEGVIQPPNVFVPRSVSGVLQEQILRRVRAIRTIRYCRTEREIGRHDRWQGHSQIFAGQPSRTTSSYVSPPFGSIWR